MLLDALLDLHARREKEIVGAYEKVQSVRWFLNVDEDGRFTGLVETGDTKKDWKEIVAPYRRRMGRSPPPYLLVDKPDYVLGLDTDGSRAERAQERHEEYKELIRQCAAEVDAQPLNAFLRFLDAGVADARSEPRCQEMKSGDLIAPRVGGTLLTKLSGVRRFWTALQQEEARESSELDAHCLLCGRLGPVARTHPVELRVGPDSAPLITGNEDAFLSYGLNQSENAPLCHECARRYGEALRHLLDSPDHRLRLSGTTVVHWTQEEKKRDPLAVLADPDSDSVQAVFDAARKGRPSDVDPDRFYVLVVSSNKRMVVRNWIETTLPRAQENAASYFDAMRIDRRGQDDRWYGLTALGGSLVRDLQDLPERFVSTLVAHSVEGTPLPHWFLRMAAERARVDPLGPGCHARAALVKMTLLSLQDPEEDPIVTAHIREDHPSPAYQCGRLLAVLDDIQCRAVSPKASLVDRYYGSASSTPASVFGSLVRGAQNHLSKLRRDESSYGLYRFFEDQLGGIMSRIDASDGFPRTLDLTQQSLFGLGFYQQKHATKQTDGDGDEGESDAN